MNKLTITDKKAHILLDSAIYVTAKSKKIPHQYTLRSQWENDDDFVQVVMYIRKNGNKERFWRSIFIYYYYNGYKYFTMGSPLHNDSKTGTILINRVKL